MTVSSHPTAPGAPAPARLVVRRPGPGNLGDLYPIRLTLDGAPLAVLMPGEEVHRELPPTRHRLRAHNTLLWRNLVLDLRPGEEVRLVARNRSGFGTMLFALLGSGPLYVALERDGIDAPR